MTMAAVPQDAKAELVAELKRLAKTYRPREDLVLFKTMEGIKSEGGLAMPDASSEGRVNYIVAVGPKVEDLKLGDRVLIVGVKNETFFEVPRQRGLYITRQSNCMLEIRE